MKQSESTGQFHYVPKINLEEQDENEAFLEAGKADSHASTRPAHYSFGLT